MPKALDDEGYVTDAYRVWLTSLNDDVIEGEFGYEPGEFTVYSSRWIPLYEEGLTPREAWQRALDGFAQKRRQDNETKLANYARIVSEDEAAVARERLRTNER